MNQQKRYSSIDEIKVRDRRPYNDRTVIEAYSRIHNTVQVATVLNLLDYDSDDLILDAGCGGGRFSLEVAHNSNIISVDFSGESLRFLSKKVKGDQSSILAVRSDIRHLPLRDNLFNGIICTEVIQHIPGLAERTSAIRELRRVLKEGGKLILLVYSYRRKLVKRRAFKRGFGGTGIFRLNFDLSDLITLVRSAEFSEYHFSGSNNLPERLLRYLGRIGVLLEIFLSTLPISVVTGEYLIAKCVK